MSIAHRHGYLAVIYYFIFTDQALYSVPHQDHPLRFAAMTPHLQDQVMEQIMGFEAKLDFTRHTPCTDPVPLRKLHYIPLGLKLSYPWAENSASCRVIVMTSVKHTQCVRSVSNDWLIHYSNYLQVLAMSSQFRFQTDFLTAWSWMSCAESTSNPCVSVSKTSASVLPLQNVPRVVSLSLENSYLHPHLYPHPAVTWNPQYHSTLP